MMEFLSTAGAFVGFVVLLAFAGSLICCVIELTLEAAPRLARLFGCALDSRAPRGEK